MAGGKETPRQKMIGMMYLVLTALLALNISKDILDAFVVVNSGLEKTVSNFSVKNDLLYSDFDKAKLFDPNKVTHLWNNAQDVRGNAQELIAYIGALKTKLIAETEGLATEVADTIDLMMIAKKDDYSAPTHIMIGNSEDGSAGKARELRDKIRTFKEQLNKHLTEKDKAEMDLGLETEDAFINGTHHTWEMHHFYHTPLAATLTMLTQIQNDIKNAEYDVVSHLYRHTGDDVIPFDTVAAKVLATTNYVLLGEEYKADLYVAAFSSTRNPEILIGKLDSAGKLIAVYDTVDVEMGMGGYIAKAQREGLQSYEGVIRVTTPAGRVKEFPFRSEYMVARPSLVVSPDKMNVFYKGPENPVSISCPGVADENLRVSISGGNTITKVANGKYIVKCRRGSPSEVSISVRAKMDTGEERNMGTLKFRAKRLPEPYARVDKISGSGTMPVSKFRVQRWLIVEYDPNFEFQLPVRATEFQLVRKKGNEISAPIPIKGNDLWSNPAAKEMVQNARRGEKFYFEEVKARNEIDDRYSPAGVIIKVR